MSKHATIKKLREDEKDHKIQLFGVPMDLTKDNMMCLPANGAFTTKNTLGA